MIGLGEVLQKLAQVLPERVRMIKVEGEKRIQVFAGGKWEYVMWRASTDEWCEYTGTDYYLSNAVLEEYAGRGLVPPERAYSSEQSHALALTFLAALTPAAAQAQSAEVGR